MARLLIVDDDFALYELLSSYLEEEGFACVHAADGDVGLELLERETWDVVVLDVMLPGKNGFEVLKALRECEEAQPVPVLMLTARGDESDKVSGLELGADDYLTKPFSARELTARLRSLMRRFGSGGADDTGSRFILDDMTIDRRSLSLRTDEREQSLTVSELRLLELFARKPGEVLDRNELCRELFGRPPFAQDRGLDMLVSRLRKKLGQRKGGGKRIRAARGEGYVFLLSGDA